MSPSTFSTHFDGCIKIWRVQHSSNIQTRPPAARQPALPSTAPLTAPLNPQRGHHMGRKRSKVVPVNNELLACGGSTGGTATAHIVFPRRKAGVMYRPTHRIEINRVLLDSLAHISVDDACKKVGLCMTAFKHACRREGIMRWPYRRGASYHPHVNKLMQNTSSTAKGIDDEKDTGCTAPMDVLQPFLDDDDLSFFQDEHPQDVAVFDEEDSAFLRMTGWTPLV
jgi:RWP-RK domain